MTRTETCSTRSGFIKALLITTILLLAILLPSVAMAQDIDGVNYEDNDYNKIVAFLNQPSATANTTNAVALGYTVDDPSTWRDITWTSTSPKRVSKIEFSRRNLSGALDVSNFTSLTSLGLSSNKISALNTLGCTQLQHIYCDHNKLTELNVTQNTQLESLGVGSNQLTKLDVTKNTKLKSLGCGGNKLTNINIANNTKLESLDCGGNKLTKLDVTKNTKLTFISCLKNQLTTLNVTKNKELGILDCSYNKQTKLDVTKNKKLFRFTCENNKLQGLDVTKNPALRDLYCNFNQLTKIDLSKNKSLRYLECNNNKLKTLEVTKTSYGLSLLNASNNPITKINVKMMKNSKPYINKITVKGSGTISKVSGSKFEVKPAKGKKVVWTENGKKISTKKKMDLSKAKNFNLVVTFK